jgi:hypothetical protein
MEKRQVLLMSMQPLLGEGLQRIFQRLEEVELVYLDCWDIKTVDTSLKGISPMMIVLAGEKEDDQSTHLISYLLTHYEHIPVMWVDLETAVLRVFTARTMNANCSELIHAIMAQDSHALDIQITEKRVNPGA